MRHLALLLLLVPALASAQAFKAGVVRGYPAGAGPSAVAIADLDADGISDVVAAYRGVDSVSVRLGSGNGQFGAPANYLVGDEPVAIAIADVDGDFVPDMIVANHGGSVTLRKGIGHGTFGPAFDFPVFGQPTALAIGDLTGDGKPDAAVVKTGTTLIDIFVGGAPGPGLALGTSVAMGVAPVSVGIADFDHDGVNDIVTASSTRDSVYVRHGVATGGFGLQSRFWVQSVPTGPLAVGDVSGDGFEDVVVPNDNGSAFLLINDGTGTLGGNSAIPIGGPATAIVIGDVDNDGLPDLASVNAALASIAVNRGLGNGQFALSPDYTATGTTGNSGLAEGDLDGDGQRDFVLASTTPARVTAFFGNGVGPFGPRTDIDSGSAPSAIAVGDVTGDGLPEIACANYNDANATVFVNSGTGTFGAAVPYATWHFPAAVALADLNGDNKKDLIVGTYSSGDTNKVCVRLNSGTGTFGARVDYDAGVHPCASFAAGEVTGDGKMDLAVARGTLGVGVLPGNGAGALGAAVPYTAHNDPWPVHLADLDGNGKLDLVVGDRSANVASVLLANGAGGFGAAADFPTGAWPLSIASGDLDGDGKLDLAVANVFGTSVSFLKGNGLGAFAPKVDIPLGHQAYAVGIGDLNRDGALDLLVGGGGTSLGIFYGKGDGAFGPRADIDCGTDQAELGIADFDGNGTLDAVTANQGDFNISVFLGRQKTRTTLVVSPNPSPVGASVTMTATVVEASPDPQAPGGIVRFFDGFTLLGSVPLTNGVAALTLPASLRWDRSLSAAYAGDDRFFGSFSAPVPHQTYVPNVAVPPSAPSALRLAPARQPCRGGELVALFALVSDAPATLDLFDVRGRRVASRSVAGGGGSVALGEAVAPGVYHLRLVQGGRVATARAVVL